MQGTEQQTFILARRTKRWLSKAFYICINLHISLQILNFQGVLLLSHLVHSFHSEATFDWIAIGARVRGLKLQEEDSQTWTNFGYFEKTNQSNQSKHQRYQTPQVSIWIQWAIKLLLRKNTSRRNIQYRWQDLVVGFKTYKLYLFLQKHMLLQKLNRGFLFQCIKLTNLQQLHNTVLHPSPFFKNKKNNSLELCINLHSSPWHWHLVLMLCAIRPLLHELSISNHYPPINSYSTIINSAQTYSMYGPNYSDISTH